jgi:hypothetical protein
MPVRLARPSREIIQKTGYLFSLWKVVQGATGATVFMNPFYRKYIHRTPGQIKTGPE